MRTIIASVLACLGLLFTGCTSLNKTYATQNTVVAQIYEQHNTGKIAAIWYGAHPKFKGTFVAYIKTVQAKLGKVTSSANVDRRMQTANQTSTVFMSQETIFERGKGTETFALLMDGERAVLVAYNIQSKAL